MTFKAALRISGNETLIRCGQFVCSLVLVNDATRIEIRFGQKKDCWPAGFNPLEYELHVRNQQAPFGYRIVSDLSAR